MSTNKQLQSMYPSASTADFEAATRAASKAFYTYLKRAPATKSKTPFRIREEKRLADLKKQNIKIRKLLRDVKAKVDDINCNVMPNHKKCR